MSSGEGGFTKARYLTVPGYATAIEIDNLKAPAIHVQAIAHRRQGSDIASKPLITMSAATIQISRTDMEDKVASGTCRQNGR